MLIFALHRSSVALNDKFLMNIDDDSNDDDDHISFGIFLCSNEV